MARNILGICSFIRKHATKISKGIKNNRKYIILGTLYLLSLILVLKITDNRLIESNNYMIDFMEHNEKDMDTLKSRISEIEEVNRKIVKQNRELEKDNKNLEAEREELKVENDSVKNKNIELESKIKELESRVTVSSRSGSSAVPSSKQSAPSGNASRFIATAYDLTPASQGIWGDKVASGKIALSGHSRESAKCIAVDPNVIPLGSIVRITVPSSPRYSGDYIAYDTGGAIKGNRIDIFMGSGNVSREVREFGRREIFAEIVGKAW